MSTNDDVPPHRLHRKEKRIRIIMTLALNCNVETGRINNGVLHDLSTTYGYCVANIKKMWKQRKEMALDKTRPFQILRKKGSGRKRKISVEELKEKVKSVPFHKRTKVKWEMMAGLLI